MKLSSPILIPALCCTARLASAATAHLYTYDSAEAGRSAGSWFDKITQQLRLSSPRTLSPTEARLVLAQRAGVEEWHAADLGKPGVLDAVNEFGLKQPLFKGNDDIRRITMLVESTDESVPSLSHATDLALSPAPSVDSARQLFTDLNTQLSSNPSLKDSTFGEAGVTIVTASKQHLEKIWQNFIDTHIPKSKSRLIMTVLVYPPSAIASGVETTGWTDGYSMPGAKTSFHQKRQEDSALTTLQDDSQTSPLPGILPACYASQSDCESTTRNCTGHGTCKLLYTDRSHGDDKRPCYACACTASIVRDSNGRTSTTYWGGPACQKRDVSMQFWLLALFSVGMVFLISFAVGSLWSMGEETLPSVIGAGVSGPSARR